MNPDPRHTAVVTQELQGAVVGPEAGPASPGRRSGSLRPAECRPRDAVAGVPADYGEAVIDNTLSLLAEITTTDALISGWQ